MTDTVYPGITTEEELFSLLMHELALVQGEELIRKNSELKKCSDTGLTALSYERCVKVIKEEFARIKRTAAKRFAKAFTLAACIVLVISAAAVAAVPSLHELVFGKPEDTSPAVLPNENTSGPTFRSCLPPTISPPPDKEEDDPGSEENLIMSQKYVVEFDLDAYIEEEIQKQREEMQQYRATHKNNLIVNGRIYNGYDINTSPKVSDPPQASSGSTFGFDPNANTRTGPKPLVPGAGYNGRVGP